MYLHLQAMQDQSVRYTVHFNIPGTSKIKAYMYYMKLRITTWYVYIEIHYDIQIFTV